MSSYPLPPLKRTKVAVLGLGVTGLVSVKNLVEIGFDVTGFERNDYFGGLWQYNEDPTQTTVLKSTISNGSKQFSPYQDFPYPDADGSGFLLLPIFCNPLLAMCPHLILTTLTWRLFSLQELPDYATADQVNDYIQSYVRNFNLEKHFRLGTDLLSVSLASSHVSPSSQWAIKFREGKGEHTEVFDRVLVATGPHTQAWMPTIAGMNQFEGRLLHSQAYKGPEPFRGKRVVVVGSAHTSGDVAVELAGVAKKIWLAHRSGGRIMSFFRFIPFA
ncbi:MAG: hypothetical protein TREMPRED_003052 [Tremellales sp. Tagirdzhanova-0007]|nr:MAG: hypothetical protein TREMPRED_003052 [Tremellales sp. Tagirdzhanova-0007]